jgi:prophage regulatory protein
LFAVIGPAGSIHVAETFNAMWRQPDMTEEQAKRATAKAVKAAAAISAGNAGGEVLYRKPTVLLLTGMGATWLHEAVKRGDFPAPVRLGARAVGWKKTEINAWLAGRERARANALFAHADPLEAEGREVA